MFKILACGCPVTGNWKEHRPVFYSVDPLTLVHSLQSMVFKPTWLHHDNVNFKFHIFIVWA